MSSITFSELLIPEPVELALHTRPPEHDFRSAEHSPAEDAAFRRALHRHTPFETVEARLAEELRRHPRG